MRKITRDAAKAFAENRPFNCKNTRVQVTLGETFLLLHNNIIAHKNMHGAIKVSLAGWPTVTTRERLNGLLYELGFVRLHIWQRDHVQWASFLDGDAPLGDTYQWLGVTHKGFTLDV